MTAKVIAGREIAAHMEAEIAKSVARMACEARPPALAVILVGDDPASSIYVNAKHKRALAVGIRAEIFRFTKSAEQVEILELIANLNADDAIDGVLVQLPLPAHFDPAAVLEAIDPQKDIDGFHPINTGRLASGIGGVVPCTPKGCLRLIRSVRGSLYGLDAVVVGCSNIVGRPMAQLLLAEQSTVSIAHAATRNLPALCRRADILVVATGHAELIRGDWVKPGATVIDVGISRRPDNTDKGYSIVGDVAFDEVRPVAGAITPVPGGVGPLTIACLLENTLEAAANRVAMR